MPIHDWTRVRANRFHHFHQDWTVEIARTLNRGILPEGYSAMAEQRTGGPEPDVVTLSVPNQRSNGIGGVALADKPVKTRHQEVAEAIRYSEKANRIVIYHPDGTIVAVIEVVSPGNKKGAHAIKLFARKAVEFLRSGIHLLIIDLFPPTKRDPQGIHALIWNRLEETDFTLPPDKPLTLAAYWAGTEHRAFVDPVAVGDAMMDMPVFLSATHYVNVPLEATYMASWDVFPKALKGPLESIK